jgi:hypothetical protein
MLYWHKSGIFLKLLKRRESNVNTFVIVDELGIPILKQSKYSANREEQRRIITGFKDLIKIK